MNYATLTSDAIPYTQHCEENIQAMCDLIESSKIVSAEENRELVNVFNGQIATPDQWI